MEKFERISALVFFILSLVICLESVRLSLGGLKHPGPGFISFLSGLFLGTFSFILYVKNKKRGKGGEMFWEVGANKIGMFLTTGVLVIYILLFELLGFLASSMLFFLLMGRLVAGKSWRFAISLSILTSFSGYLIFEIWFQSHLPKGLIEGSVLWIFGRISF